MVNLDQVKGMPRIPIGKATLMLVGETTVTTTKKCLAEEGSESSKIVARKHSKGAFARVSVLEKEHTRVELCEMEDRDEEDKYFTARMTDLPEAKADTPLKI
ncbi:hypothetical protein B296_00045638 [Ensete ventricosum]|uniref:Uncharacterized protein n=1 Tax=Ensete ventricosum TaxID=4639 RepID=A0A426YRG7_ENSVE|nr:hypothetical protein B296_00045638 [Ensete ventricosum]